MISPLQDKGRKQKPSEEQGALSENNRKFISEQ
jgi:hypothetical protein